MADKRSTDKSSAEPAGKSTEDQMEKIDAIVGSEVLGYEGGAREEISGGTAPRKKSGDPKDSLADNKPEDLGKKP